MFNQISPPITQPGQATEEDAAMDEEMQCNDIPISNFKSNNIQKKEKYMQLADQLSPRGKISIEAPLSPGASFAMRDGNFKEQAAKSFIASAAQFGAQHLGGQLSPRSEGRQHVQHCVCGLPMRDE
jgi:hypothetical protein